MTISANLLHDRKHLTHGQWLALFITSLNQVGEKIFARIGLSNLDLFDHEVLELLDDASAFDPALIGDHHAQRFYRSI